MDPDFRASEFEKINVYAKDISDLKYLKRAYSMYEIAIMTRAAPAKILGLKDRGSLKDGSIADISVYELKQPCMTFHRSDGYSRLDRIYILIRPSIYIIRIFIPRDLHNINNSSTLLSFYVILF